MKLTEELKKTMLGADRLCQYTKGDTHTSVWVNENGESEWVCGESAPQTGGKWEHVTTFNSYYLDNLYSSDELEDFDKTWTDFVESYSGVIDDDYAERLQESGL